MELNPEQLGSALEKKLHNAYLITGDDLWHKQDCLNKIKARATGFDIAPIIQIENEKSWQNFVIANDNLSLFADKKLYQINLATPKLTAKSRSIILSYITKPSANTCLVIVMPKISAAEKKAAWYKKFNENNVIITVWPLFANQIPSWVNSQLKKFNLTADHAAIEALISQHHNNLPALAQSIDKIALIHTNKKLSLEDIKPILYGQNKFTPYDFIEAIAAGNPKKTMDIIDNLKQELSQINVILYILATEIAEALFPNKNSYMSNLKKNRIQKLQQKLLNKDQQKIITTLREIEKAVKGMSLQDPWHEITLLALMIARP